MAGTSTLLPLLTARLENKICIGRHAHHALAIKRHGNDGADHRSVFVGVGIGSIATISCSVGVGTGSLVAELKVRSFSRMPGNSDVDVDTVIVDCNTNALAGITACPGTAILTSRPAEAPRSPLFFSTIAT